MNYVIARRFLNFRQNGSVLDKVLKVDKLHLKRSSLSPESSTRTLTFNITFFADFDGSGQKIYQNILMVNILTKCTLSVLFAFSLRTFLF